jgi:hypothetical protein
MRQHSTPILLGADSGTAQYLEKRAFGGTAKQRGYDEKFIQELILRHPEVLPIGEIDATCLGPLPICDELPTPAGPVDVLLITEHGVPVLVECKLSSNAESRREVVGQVLDYAKELQRWTYDDLQRAAASRVGTENFDLFQFVSEQRSGLDQRHPLTTGNSQNRTLRTVILETRFFDQI